MDVKAPGPRKLPSRTSTSSWPSACGTARCRPHRWPFRVDNLLIHVDVNPDNLGRNMPAHVAVCADSRVFLDRLLVDADAIRRPPCPALWQRIAKLRQVDRCEAVTVRIAPCVDPMFFLSQLRAALGPDELIFVDVTAATHWAAESFEVPGPRRYFTPADNQSMGWAIPAAIGGQRVRPDRQVACVTGDGCFLMSAIEMSSAARAGLPVKFFVLDDGGYHYMQMLAGTDLSPDHGDRDCADRSCGLCPERRPLFQPDRRQRRRARGHPAGAHDAGTGTDAGGGQLRGT